MTAVRIGSISALAHHDDLIKCYDHGAIARRDQDGGVRLFDQGRACDLVADAKPTAFINGNALNALAAEANIATVTDSLRHLGDRCRAWTRGRRGKAAVDPSSQLK